MTEDILDLVRNLHPGKKRGLNDHILLVDGLNMFIRAFSANRTINSQGHHIGGLLGFLRTLNTLNRTFNPTRIIIVWDGKGGAQNRKNIDSNYKAQRVHASVIHYDIYDDKVSELESMQGQADRLQDYLACLPVSFVKIDKLEADDVIAYLSKKASEAGKQVTVASTDRDFLQLVDEHISVYSPTKKILYGHENTPEELKVLPENYNIVKAIVGDNSDNLAGVKGAGVRTLAKYFPELTTNPNLTLDEFFDLCTDKSGKEKKVLYTKILADWHRVETNYKLMDLQETVLDESEKELVYRILHQPVPELHVGQFIHYLDQDYIELSSDPESWVCSFSSLEHKV